MRIVLGFCVLFCLAIVGFGIHLVLEEQRRLASFSATTPALVLNKRVERHRIEHRRPGDLIAYRYEPVVTFRFEAHGQRFTSNRVFPSRFQAGGNLGWAFAKATVDRFPVGQDSTAYYDPNHPAEACLIRRPSLFLYLAMLGPVIPVAVVGCFWQSRQATGVEFKRRKARWIAALWHLVGLAAAGHYFGMAGADYARGAVALFGIYIQFGLIPVAVALPPSQSSEFSRRVKNGVALSIFGTWGGFLLGGLTGWLVAWASGQGLLFLIQWMGYTIALGATLGAVLGLLSQRADGSEGSQSAMEEKSMPDRSGRAASLPKSDHSVSLPAPPGPIPYQIDQRPMPEGERVETLLPALIGPFRRQSIEEPDDLSNPIYAQYRSDAGAIFVELGICGDPAGARRGVNTSKAETDAEFPNAPQQFSLDSEPSFFKTNTPLGAFMSWTRGRYYFSAQAKGGEKDLDPFLEAFPY